ncbi:MAG TPA: lysine-2,3-aminomutase-like protein [Roseiarcus sp.]|nr:lysine-2,3-aminomutase-like protein [Roseiarcus sp.]
MRQSLSTQQSLSPDRAAAPRVLKTAADLVAAGLVAEARAADLARVAERYAMAITPALAALIDPADSADPIARQFVPDARELVAHPAELADPIGDDLKSPVRGIVHRYPDRALLKLVSVCAVYCRFCFRRETVGPGGAALSGEELEAALAYLRARREIWEVVLTGGDPLVLSPRRLAAATRALADIPHVKVLRWHTRLPVADPAKVDSAMAKALADAPGKAVYVALHVNHPRELTDAARAACKRLIDAGAAMVSQTVLLKGVNDNVETLDALMRALVETRIKPYYLHHGDLAPGTAHLRTTIAEGQALMRQLRGRLSGLGQPTYVLDIPGAHGKAPIGPGYAQAAGEGRYEISDPAGVVHLYTDCCSEEG